MNIGQKLHEYRERRGLNKAALAEQIGITKQSYQAIETGKTRPRLETLVKLSQVLRVSTDILLGNDTSTYDYAKNALNGIARIEDQEDGQIKVTLCKAIPCYEIMSKDELVSRVNNILLDREHLADEFARQVIAQYAFARLHDDEQAELWPYGDDKEE